MSKQEVHAVAIVSVKITLTQKWYGDISAEHFHQVASSEAVGKLRVALNSDPNIAIEVGTLKIGAIIIDTKDNG